MNRMQYSDDIILFAPSVVKEGCPSFTRTSIGEKGLKNPLDKCYLSFFQRQRI